MRLPALTAALATALAGTGCIVTSSEPTGSVDLFWQFVRTKWDGTSLVYDQESLTPPGANGTCPQSGVDTVTVTWPGGSVTADCRRSGSQGVALDGVPAGLVPFTVTGYQGPHAVFRSTQTIDVPAGPPSAAVSRLVEVAALYDSMDVYFVFTDALGIIPNATCASEGVDYFLFDIYDGAGTKVVSTSMFAGGKHACVEGFPGPGVALDGIDFDAYTIRAQAFENGFATPVFDSCDTVRNTSANFGHYATDTGATFGWKVNVQFGSCP